jgi:DNA polymerase-1
LAAFAEGADIHQRTAAHLFGIAPEEVTSEQRRSAKVVNFGLMYGMSGYGLAKQLNIAPAAAETYMERYFAGFPKVKTFFAQIKSQAMTQGYVETLLGRRLYLPEIHASNIHKRRAAERAAINAPMQGTNADIIKLAMIALHRWINTDMQAQGVHMIMQVHDELVFEVPDLKVSQMIPEIRAHMEGVLVLNVPLQVDIRVGRSWGEVY